MAVFSKESPGKAKSLAFTRRLRERMKDKGIVQEDVARQLDIKQATVSLYFRNPDDLKGKGVEYFIEFVRLHGFSRQEALEITREYFADEFKELFGNKQGFEKYAIRDMQVESIPVRATASAGMGDSDDLEGHTTIPKAALKGHEKENVFAVLVNGNCLVSHEVRYSPKNIAHGDYAFIDERQAPKNTDSVLYWDNRDEKLIIKLYKEQGGNIILYDARGVMVPKAQFDNDLTFRGVVFWRSGGMTL